MAKTADLEIEGVETLLAIAKLRAERPPLTDDEATVLSFTEQWLKANTDGMRMPPVATKEERARG